MDTFDKKILVLLQANSKLTTKEIADKIGLSVTPTYERIRKMEKLGIIKNYVAILDGNLIEKGLVAFCHISLTKHTQAIVNNFNTIIIELPEVMSCYHIAGNFDFIIKIRVKDMNEFKFFVVNKLTEFDNIANIQSSFVIDNIKESTSISI